MTPAEAIIKETIRSHGPISFEGFMEAALYSPQHGYYMNESTTIGREGDYYTSSSLHKIFAMMIAEQLQEICGIMGTTKNNMPFTFVECGAGMGYFALDLLDAIKDTPIFSQFNYITVEINPFLASRQHKLLQRYTDKIQWVQRLEDIKPFSGIIFSNELLDAFPVRLIELQDGVPFEVWVNIKDDRFVEELLPCSKDTENYVRDFLPQIFEDNEYQDGYRTEINLHIKDWLTSAAGRLIEGFIITIDYGYTASEYYSPERNRGTLMCYHRHQVGEDPYINIGCQDITAHVNFSSLHRWGCNAGLSTCGFSPQGSYLISLGLDKTLGSIYGDNPDPFETAKIKRLILPQGLGESHKVMIQYKGGRSPKLRGFQLRNRMHSL